MITPSNPNNTIENFNLKMGDTVLEEVTEIEYLGVIFDRHFTWKPYVRSLAQTLSRSAGVLSKLRYYVPVNIMQTVYYAIVYSHIQYAILCWGPIAKSIISDLQVIQNRAVRMVGNFHRRTNVNYMYLNLRFLNIENIFQLELSKFMYRFNKNMLPKPFSNSFGKISDMHSIRTRSASSNKLYLPNFKKKSGRSSIKFLGVQCFNDIPEEWKNLKMYQFKEEMKKNMLSKL